MHVVTRDKSRGTRKLMQMHNTQENIIMYIYIYIYIYIYMYIHQLIGNARTKAKPCCSANLIPQGGTTCVTQKNKWKSIIFLPEMYTRNYISDN